MMKFLISHWAAIVLSIFVGAICIAPQIVAINDSSYRGIQMFGADAEYDYVAKINQAQYDDYSNGPFPPDQSKNYYLAPMMAERAVSLFGKVFGLSAISVNMIAKFILPSLLFLILYAFFSEMFSARPVALVAPLFIILSPNLLDFKELISFFSLKTEISTFLPYTRPISPQFSSILMFVCLWITYKFVKKEIDIKFAVIYGLISGLSLYVYIYTWSFVLVFMVIYGLHFFIIRNLQKVKLMAIALLANIITTIPFFINLLKARTDADYIDTTARIGLATTHEPIAGLFMILGFCALLFLWPKYYLENIKRYLLYIFVSITIVLNQQIITGIKLQPGHFHWYIMKPFLIVVFIFLFFYYINKITHGRRVRIMTIFVVAVVALSAVIVQVNSFSSNYDVFIKDQEFAPIISHLSSNYNEKKTIWAEHRISTLILAYTKHYAPDNLHTQYYISGASRLKDMLFLENRISKIGANRIDNFSINGWNNYIVGRIFGIDSSKQYSDEKIITSELNTLSSEYNKFKSVPLDNAIKNLKIDLLVVKKNQLLIDPSKLSFLIKDGEIGQFLVYRSND